MNLVIKILVLLLILLVLFTTAAYLMIPYIFNLDQIKLTISQMLQETTGRKISIDKITASLVSGPGFKIEGFKIFEENGKDLFFSTDRLYISLHLSSLVTGKFSPKKIVIDAPDIRIKRDEKGVLNLDSIIASLKKIKKEPPLLSKILLKRVTINGGRMEFKDFFNLENPRGFRYEEVEINVKNFSFIKPVEFSFFTRFPNDRGGISSFELKGVIDRIPLDFDPEKFKLTASLKINSFNLVQFFHYYGDFLPFPNFDGIADIRVGIVGNLKDNFSVNGNMKFSSLLIDYPKFYANPIRSESGSLKFNLKLNRDSINIKDYQIKIDGLDFTGNCLFENLHSEDKAIALEVNSNFFAYEEWKKYIPDKILPASLSKFLKENLAGGEIRLTPLKISGKIKNIAHKRFFENPNQLTIAADYENVDMLLGNNLSPIKIIKGNLVMKDGDIVFLNSKATFGKSPCQLISGKIAELYKMPHLFINAKCNPRIYDMTEFFKASFIPENIRSEMKAIHYQQGSADLNLFLDKILHKEYPFSYRGELFFNGGGLLYERLKSPAYNLEGNARFNTDEISLDRVVFKLKDSSITVNGVIKDYRKEIPFFSLALGGNVSSSVIAPFLTSSQMKKFKPEGLLGFRLGLDGKINSAVVKGDIDLTDLGYSLGEEFIKEKFYPNKLRIEGKIFEKRNLFIDKLAIILGINEFKATGAIYDFKTPSANISLKTEEFDLKNARQAFPFLLKHDATGKLSGEFHIVRDAKDFQGLKLFPNLDLENSTINIEKSRVPVKKIEGSFILLDDSFSFTDVSVNLGDNRFILSGKVTDFKNPKIDMGIKTPLLRLDKLFINEEEKSDSEFRPGNLDLSDLSAKLNYANKVFNIEKLTAKFFDGDIFLKGWIDHTYREEYRFQFYHEVKNSDIKKIFGYLGVKDSDFAGKVDFTGTFSAKGKSNYEIKRNLNGHVTLVSKNGKFKKTGFGILSKILSFFNFFKWHEFWIKDIQVNGMPYKSLTGDFYIKSGILSTDNLFLDGNAMKMSAVGSIDTVKGNVDMKLGVQPLGTVDEVISNIPVIGYIFGGDNKSIVTAYFEVKGDIKNPAVNSIPIESLGNGIMGIFKRLLTYPEHLISPGK